MEITEKVAYLFPGQGAQQVGMGKDLYENSVAARQVFQEADQELGFELSRLCFEGPEDELRQTNNAQPALVTASYACLQAAREKYGDKLPQASFVAGHSLGEYTALLASDAFDFKTAVRLSRERGRLMNEAGVKNPGSMAAIIGFSPDEVAELAATSDTSIANDNCPGQVVLSGAKDNVNRAIEMVIAKGKGKAVSLAVSAAFHSPLMQPAVAGMRQELDKVTINQPQVPIVANFTASVSSDSQAIKNNLLEQICHCVLWRSSMEMIVASGVKTVIEFGSGKVLSGLMRRIDRSIKTINISDLESIEALEK